MGCQITGKSPQQALMPLGCYEADGAGDSASRENYQKPQADQ
jgi:hypothetical protein